MSKYCVNLSGSSPLIKWNRISKTVTCSLWRYSTRLYVVAPSLTVSTTLIPDIDTLLVQSLYLMHRWEYLTRSNDTFFAFPPRAVESLALSLMAGFEQCWGTVHVSVLTWWTELHCLVLRLITVCSLTAVFVHDDVQRVMSLSAPTSRDGLRLRDVEVWVDF